MSPTPYRVTFTDAAARQIRRLDRPVQRRLLAAADRLSQDPRPHGIKALQGAPSLLRLRVGDYRLIYTVKDLELLVLVVTVGHRREVYRGL